MGWLDAKIALVTGGASGIGRATAQRMAAEGAAVVIGDIDQAGAETVAKEIVARGGSALAVRADVAHPEQIAALVERSVAHFGALHVLCNNAADLSLLEFDGDFLQTEIETWDRTWAANLRSVMAACKYALPHLIAARGAIVNVSSVDGVSGDNTRFAYAASKSGINVLTLCTAATYGKLGVRCNAVLPGLVMTTRAEASFAAHPELRQAFASNIMATHVGTPEEIAAVIVFLASDMASYVNGELIKVDGGLMSHVPHLAQTERYYATLAGR